jgi:argininosuccinate lyase
MWGGRFAGKPSAVMSAINASIDVDQRLAAQDVAGSKAHASMLAAQGIISAGDCLAINAGLDAILARIQAGDFVFSRELEDIHLNIERSLSESIGEAGRRLHTARSRNDQVATDFRLWTREACQRLATQIRVLQTELVAAADSHVATVMPGFTHLQTAQPVTLGHHLMAYVEMLERDRGRFVDAFERMNECPLGAAALAGTSFPIDRHMTARALGFAAPTANSLDSVASRDFALEALSAASICAVQLSRLADEIVLWTSAQFGFARLSDAWSTGSSIMPQKRNPDAAELVRAKAASISAAFQALAMTVKALPLAYAKDLQDDKSITFGALDSLELCLEAMAGMVPSMTFDRARMKAAAGLGYSTATDLADWLVRVLGLPFRDAHHVTGAIVKRAELADVTLDQLPLETMQLEEPRITDAVFSVLTVEASVASRASYGGTAPVRVGEQVARWKEILR